MAQMSSFLKATQSKPTTVANSKPIIIIQLTLEHLTEKNEFLPTGKPNVTEPVCHCKLSLLVKLLQKAKMCFHCILVCYTAGIGVCAMCIHFKMIKVFLISFISLY